MAGDETRKNSEVQLQMDIRSTRELPTNMEMSEGQLIYTNRVCRRAWAVDANLGFTSLLPSLNPERLCKRIVTTRKLWLDHRKGSDGLMPGQPDVLVPGKGELHLSLGGMDGK